MSDAQLRFLRETGARFFADPSRPAAIQFHLRALGWLQDDRVVSVEKLAGGNMNLTLRLHLTHRSVVLKQARPWAEKYPDIPAPVERARVEAAFYATIAASPEVSRRMPALLHADPESYLLLLEDVPGAIDLTALYSGARLTHSELEECMAYLNALHALPLALDVARSLRNPAMRALNHAHQFELPLAKTTPDWTPCDKYRARVAELGRIYLDDGPTLLHGDYFPGSWLRSPAGFRVIDPEFCFPGRPEFDLGILRAHLIFAAHGDLWPRAQSLYAGSPDWKLVDGFAGVELMRRIIGVAQLPLQAGPDQRREWLDMSSAFLCD